MTPVNCRVGHHPDKGTYGDCVRACVATLLDIADGDKVPHFYHDNDAEAGHARMVEYLATQGLTPYIAHLPGTLSLDDVLTNHGDFNPTAHYILFGGLDGGGDHAVVCKGGAVVHNPAWVPCSLRGPLSIGVWQILLLVRA